MARSRSAMPTLDGLTEHWEGGATSPSVSKDVLPGEQAANTTASAKAAASPDTLTIRNSTNPHHAG
jgi:hypothetical protein